jgi:hypothetical protein
MAMPQASGVWTREMVLALPDDGNRYELFDGELLVTPAPIPRHQIAVQFLSEAIAPYVRREKLGLLMLSPADLDLGGDQLSQPDVFVLPKRPNPLTWRGAPPERPKPSSLICPSSLRRRVRTKRAKGRLLEDLSP